MKAVWISGYGGIGKALEKELLSKGVKVTILSSRSAQPIDVCNAAEVNHFVESADCLPDALVITNGLLHNTENTPEKSISQCSAEWLHESVNANVLPTLNFSAALSKRLDREHIFTLASFSARVSSISDNRLGGWHSYRMSKCMLNMLIKTISLEWRRTLPNAVIFGYHPGTVDTGLSAPFQANLKPGQLFTPTEAAKYFIRCFDKATIRNSGKIYDWQQEEISP